MGMGGVHLDQALLAVAVHLAVLVDQGVVDIVFYCLVEVVQSLLLWVVLLWGLQGVLLVVLLQGVHDH